MKYGSVCSGIEAATAAWHPLGWEPAFFSEIEAFPSAVLAHHYPAVPNLGDMTKFKEWPNANINVLVGGTPCQSFSVAGLRKGLDDPRGNLMLTFGSIAAKYRPEWLVWENVPGVLSANGGRDFGTFLGMLGQLGYGFAYRVLDAFDFSCPIPRPRVFVVGNSRGWRCASAALFQRKSFENSSEGARRRPSPHTLSTQNAGSRNGRGNIICTQKGLRAMSCVETERSLGFPDNFTRIPYRNKPVDKCPDGPRYKALGNSMAVPVMRWIGERIQAVDDVYRAECDPVEAQA